MNSDYKVPDEILKKIPTHFYTEFAGELCNIFDTTIFEKIDDDYGLFYVEGTSGWVTAFMSSTIKLDLTWLSNYYNSLDWFDSDLFDAKICELLIQHLINNNQMKL